MSQALPQAVGGAGDGVTLTPAAQAKALEFLKGDRQGNDAVRVTFTPDGKVGLALDKRMAGDRVYRQGDVSVVVSSRVADLVKGLRVDFVAEAGKDPGFAVSGTAPVVVTASAALEAYRLSLMDEPVAQDDHHAGELGQYLKIGIVLAVLTAIELVGQRMIGQREAMITFLLTCAVVKAVLVALFFMHLKFEGRWKYVLVIPPLVLACVLVIFIMPDVGLFHRTIPPTPRGDNTSMEASH